MKLDELGLLLVVGYILFGCYLFFGHGKFNLELAVLAVFYAGIAIWDFITERFFK